MRESIISGTLSILIGSFFVSTVVLAQGAEALVNPLGDLTLRQFLEGIVGIILVLAIPIVVFFLIYAGFMFVTARGNPQTLEQAKRALIYGIVGGVIIISGYAIIAIVNNFVEVFK